jgi:hypothetical protein
MIALRELIFESIEGYLAGVNICLPGRVTAYDASKRLASVKPLVKRRYSDGVARALPIINGVPVVMPQTGSGGLILDVAPGDLVALIFADRSLDKWVAGSGNEVDPQDPRRFDLSDAICIPGLFPFSRANPNSGMRIKISAGGKIAIGKDSSHELLKLIEEFITDMRAAVYGTYGMAPNSQAVMDELKAKFESIRGNL